MAFEYYKENDVRRFAINANIAAQSLSRELDALNTRIGTLSSTLEQLMQTPGLTELQTREIEQYYADLRRELGNIQRLESEFQTLQERQLQGIRNIARQVGTIGTRSYANNIIDFYNEVNILNNALPIFTEEFAKYASYINTLFNNFLNNFKTLLDIDFTYQEA